MSNTLVFDYCFCIYVQFFFERTNGNRMIDMSNMLGFSNKAFVYICMVLSRRINGNRLIVMSNT